MEKSTPRILPSNIDAPRSSCTPRNVVVVNATLVAKEEKKAELDSQSGTPKRLHHHHHGKVEKG
jgi:hypothetical protein